MKTPVLLMQGVQNTPATDENLQGLYKEIELIY